MYFSPVFVEKNIVKEKQSKTQKSSKASKKSLIGGQALIEGVMMRSATSMAMAVRDGSGNILLNTTRLKGAKKWYKKIPVVRGVTAFIDSLVLSLKTTMKSVDALMLEDEVEECGTPKSASPTDEQAADARIPMNRRGCTLGHSENVSETSNKKASKPKNQKKEKDKQSEEGGLGIWLIISMLFGLILGVGLFFIIPLLINMAIEDYISDNLLLQSLVEGAIRMAIFIAYLFLTSIMKTFRRMYGYHGAEHRVIACFERGLELNVDNAQTCSTRHNRCGTTFLFFVVTLSIFVFFFATWVLDLMGLNQTTVGGNSFVWALTRIGVRLALLPFVAGLSFELLRLLAKFPDSFITWPLRAPGLALQRLTTYPPSSDMVEVALIAYNEVTAMDENPDLKMLEFGQFRYSYLRPLVEEKLSAIGAESVEVDWIFCSVSGYKRNELHKLNIITYNQYGKIKRIVQKRTGKLLVENPLAIDFVGPRQKFEPEPLWYALGEMEFYGETIKVDKRVLIPRPETEMLAEQAILEIESRMAKSKDGIIDVLDMCTGSGAIAKVLAKNTNANITVVDVSYDALEVAKSNLQDTKVVVIQSDLFENLQDRKFDIIVCNPPYIKSGDIDTLQSEVKNCEPHLALDGGMDGLDFYKRLAQDAPKFLKPKGSIMLEVGINQATDVWQLLTDNFTNIQIIKDLENIDRFVIAIIK